MVRLRVRARAVDMLGRQQIAGIPTAIHELFKNAHDAYAERAEVDYFRRTRVMVLRDDGYGMTRDDVESRWLTLGTESRIGANRPNSIANWTGPRNLPRRTVLGEKGIGRLAIGVIAPITILLTRAVRPEGLHDPVVALVHWGLFEQPGLDINAIDVPIIELPGGALPTRHDIQGLIEKVRVNIQDLQDDLEPEAYQRLTAELDSAKNISPDVLDSTLSKNFSKIDESSLSLTNNGHGTHFILLPTVPELNDDIDGGSDKDASNLEKNLLGFSNTMTGIVPVIRTEFRDHHLDEQPTELIGPKNFFVPEEFGKADHHIFGTFDEFGQFSGGVNIYAGETKPFICNWVEGKGRPIRCGSFSIDFGYLMGLQRETRLSKDEFLDLNKKLDRIGGLYIYRNGIRILPYGNSDIDFLDVEKRRNKSAQDWFFSFRRIFGFVSITDEQNHSLNEKAGREGFRQNQAYRDFRAVLINLFQRLAFEFFREKAPQSEEFWQQKKSLTAESYLLDKQKKKADNRRAAFKESLEKFFESYEADEFRRTAEQIRLDADYRIKKLSELENDGDLAIGVRELEKELSKRINQLEAENTINKPRGLALTQTLEKDWTIYQRMALDVRSAVIDPVRKNVDAIIRTGTMARISESQRREAALTLLSSQRDSLVRDLSAMRNEVYGASTEMTATLQEVIREEFSKFRQETETLLVEFTRNTAQRPERLEEMRSAYEREILLIRQREETLLDAIQRQLKGFSEALRDRETTEDQTGALEQRAQRLEEQLEFYSEFAQMGMSVGILQHEFEKTASNLRATISDMKPWADGTPALGKVYKRLRASFEHLDGYLAVLDPLGRRLRRKKVVLSGDEIRIYLKRIFGQTLEADGIKLEVTNEFLSQRIECFSSAILGAFVNVVDNAIYWVANGAQAEKVVKLDADGNGFFISNTGPGIEERNRDRIFDFGETSKPGGRGMGLAISRSNLTREGFGIELIQSGSGVNPIFKIFPVQHEGVRNDG